MLSSSILPSSRYFFWTQHDQQLLGLHIRLLHSLHLCISALCFDLNLSSDESILKSEKKSSKENPHFFFFFFFRELQ